jgi:hypothetical protein
MSNKVRIIVGLPGSGKTYYAEHNPFGLLFDDPAAEPDTFEQLKSAVMSFQDVTITDVYSIESLARTITLTTLKTWNPDAEIEWIFFENDPAACIANIESRNDDRLVSPEFVREASRHYDFPDDAKILPVYKEPLCPPTCSK